MTTFKGTPGKSQEAARTRVKPLLLSVQKSYPLPPWLINVDLLQSWLGGIGLNTNFISNWLGYTILTFHNTLVFCLFAPTEVFQRLRNSFLGFGTLCFGF